MFEVQTADARTTLAAAIGFLQQHPAENNVVWEVLQQQAARPLAGRFFWVHDARGVAGVAVHTPLAARMVLTPMTAGAAVALADFVTPPLPGVMSDAATAAAFAGRWATRHHVAARPIDAQLLHGFDSGAPGVDVPAGRARSATEDDRELLAEWIEGFLGEEGNRARRPDAMVETALARRDAWLWENGEPVAMARASPGIGGVSRIFGVFTPPPHRRRGYASALVESMSRRLAAEGVQATLQVRLTNPTANAIYARIGFVTVAELLSFRFDGEPRDG
jgi:predicted GNAT family acetyltransferase